METPKFERLVRQALEGLPDELRLRLDHVAVGVDDFATREQLVGSGLDEDECLLGLYEGIPLPDRYGYDMVLPDKITLFQRSIESICSSDQEDLASIQATVVPGAAHHFGIDDEALDRVGV